MLLPVLLLYLLFAEALELVVALATPITGLFPKGTFDEVKFPVIIALTLMRGGLKELLLASPEEAFAERFEKKIMPLKEQLGAKQLSLEILKTGRRVWVTVFIDSEEDTLHVDEFMAIKTRLRDIVRRVHPNTQTEVILERI